MQLPAEIRAAAEENAARFAHKELQAAANSISERYRAEKADGSRIVTKAAEAAAYAVTRMPATFAAISSALEHTLKHFTGELFSAADIGAGTGAAAAAISGFIGDITELHCFEREPEMRKLGEKLTEAHWHDLDMTKGELSRSFDLITLCYALNELSEADRGRVITSLWEHTDKLLLITEPGTPAGYRSIISAREQLISLGASIAAPCPAAGSCPLGKDDWCHFTARAERSKLHKQLKGGDAPYEDEKFSYIAAVRGNCRPCDRRILRHPQISPGFIDLRVCTKEGISDIKITKKSPDFKTARKTESGDSI
ncbi:MAG: rRNA methyltransferase [Ruminiclostridium sp.]|nr:rRNA methyltransferase [Ruminiclostridium sp.]